MRLHYFNLYYFKHAHSHYRHVLLSTVGAKVVCAKLKGTCAVAVFVIGVFYWDRGLAVWCCHAVTGARSPALWLEDLRPCR